jgi:hypothetical protein
MTADPYVDPHAYIPYDYRTDPTQRTNPTNFWLGYGKYREGTNYTELPDDRDCMAGWCYASTEGRTPPKPLWQSKSFYNGISLILLSLWGLTNAETIIQNPEAVASIGAVIGVLEILIRTVTKGPIK